ncbi:MAG: hypothetical protein IT204_06035 [Fimbriimonadaceae bacterium]|nr:hypothetical protein [Fimbriimonadaceae bacterium]
MATAMTSQERFRAVFERREPDRIPRHDSFWAATLERWRAEGLPADVSPAQHFGFDRIGHIACDNSPRLPVQVLAETPEYRIQTTVWGVTQKVWTHRASVPEFLDFTVVDRASWARVKERMTPAEDRVNWAHLERAWRSWRESGAWIVGGGWFGFDVLHSWFVGTERVLLAMAEDPDWVREMIDTMLDLNLAMLEAAWDRGYTFDCLRWPDDLAFVKGPFFSNQMYRDIVQPAHRRACEWAHAHGAYVLLHTDGNIWPLLPDIVAAGVDATQPLEQKAGMSVPRLKREWGDRLVLEGGVDVRLMTDPVALEAHLRENLAAAMPGGGYIYHSDHSIPSDVSLADYTHLMRLVEQYGRY